MANEANPDPSAPKDPLVDFCPDVSLPSLRFLRCQHLRSSSDFRRLYQRGQRAGDDHLLVFALRNELPITRIGLSVSRKHGSAVQRNRKKRLMREAFRLLQHQLPAGLDLVLVPRQRDDSTLQGFRSSLTILVEKLAVRLPATQRRQHQAADLSIRDCDPPNHVGADREPQQRIEGSNPAGPTATVPDFPEAGAPNHVPG